MTDRPAPLSTSPAAPDRDAVALAIAALVAAVFFYAAMTPSMLPRTPLVQGFVSGAAAAIGFQLSYFLRWLWNFLELPRTPVHWNPRLRLVLFGLAAAIVLYGLWRGFGWQNDTRAAVSLEPLESYEPLTVLLFSAIFFVVFWAILRGLGFILRQVVRLLNKVLPPKISLALGFVLVAWLAWSFANGVLATGTLRLIDESFRIADGFVDPEIPRPASPLKSGSETSLVKWAEMGRFGREYVADTPTRDALAEFAGPSAMEPLRVYVGMRSAETARERAELALQELIRVGGFDRSVLMLVIPTGTGWMDPGAFDTLDYMMGGDIATVVVQYSYLPSALALLAGAEIGVEQARELFNVIYGYWTTLPKDKRPKFYVHGLSLGAFNLQVAMPLLDLLADPFNGAMWAGSPFFSPVWNRVHDGRKPGSPPWQPLFGNGSLARVLNQDGTADTSFAPWGPTRLVFLNYGSDPIAAFTFDSAVRPPDWLDNPRAHDITPDLRWFPVVTMIQVAVDTAFSMAVPGYGHYYIAPNYIDAWAALLDPPGWSAERSDALKATFAKRPFPI